MFHPPPQLYLAAVPYCIPSACFRIAVCVGFACDASPHAVGTGASMANQSVLLFVEPYIENLVSLVVKVARQAKMRDVVWFSFFVVVLASASGKQQPLEPLTKFRAYCIALWHRGQTCGECCVFVALRANPQKNI